MKIELSSIGVQEAAGILENLAMIGMNSAELPTEITTSLFEVMGSLAAAIRTETEAAA